MTAERYARWTAGFRGRRRGWVARADRVLTALVFAAYPVVLAVLWRRDGAVPWRALGVPALSLVLVSLLRTALNRPRPYERLPITPLIEKSTRGRAFPSRHVFSAFMIAATACGVSWAAGGVLIALSVGLMATRVLGGVHDEWDVLAGAVCGLGLGAVGYWLL